MDFPEKSISPSIRAVNTRNSLEQRRFACAVCPHQGNDGPFFHGERHVPQGLNIAIEDIHPLYFENTIIQDKPQ